MDLTRMDVSYLLYIKAIATCWLLVMAKKKSVIFNTLILL